MQHGVWSCRIRVPPRTLPLLAAAAALLPPIASAWAFRAPHDLGSRRLSLSCPAHRQRNAQRRVSLQHSPVVAQDLRDGMDEERNAQVAALKKSFYATSGDRTTSASEAEADSKQRWSLLGVLEDIPLCRWEMVMLPGFNQVLNVFQPMYTHMFESILASAKPCYYVHLQTPGGTDSLTNPDFELRTGSKAPMVGVLMRIVAAERREDSRLSLIVQGLTRVRVLEQTQKHPYARATVQLLPDAEITASYYSRATTELLGIPEELLGSGAGGAGVGAQERLECDRWVHTVSHAAAAASEAMWLEFEYAPSVKVHHPGASVSQLCAFNDQKGLEQEIASRAQHREIQAMRDAKAVAAEFDALASAASAGDASSDANANGSAETLGRVDRLGAPVLSPTDLVLSGILGGRQSGASLPTWAGWQEWVALEGLHWNRWGEWQDDMEDEKREPADRSLSPFWVASVEAKLWIEIDALVRNLRRIDERLPLPPGLLALLPEPPEGGWPPEFMLHLMAEYMLDGETPLAVRAKGGADGYGALRRAQKVSYCAWCLLGLDQYTGADVSRPMTPDAQAILEVPRTQDRMALLLCLITDINGRLPRGR